MMVSTAAKPNLTEVTVDAIRFQQGDKVMYLCCLKATLLRTFTEVHRYNPARSPAYEDQGYQRELAKKRVTAYGRYLINDVAGICPPLIANDRFGSIRWDEEKKQITLSADMLLQLIDGQHREAGVDWIRREPGGLDQLGTFDVPMMVTTFKDKAEEMKVFQTVNGCQASVKTDLVNELRLVIAELSGEEAIPAKAMAITVCTEATRNLQNRKSGILAGRICMASVKKLTHRQRIKQVPKNSKLKLKNLFTCNSFEGSLKPVYRLMEEWDLFTSSTYKGKGAELADVVGAWWDAVASLMPKAFSEPDDYMLHQAQSAYVMHSVLLLVMKQLTKKFGDGVPQYDDVAYYYNEILNAECFADADRWALGDGEYARYGSSHSGAARIVKQMKADLKLVWDEDAKSKSKS